MKKLILIFFLIFCLKSNLIAYADQCSEVNEIYMTKSWDCLKYLHTADYLRDHNVYFQNIIRNYAIAITNECRSPEAHISPAHDVARWIIIYNSALSFKYKTPKACSEDIKLMFDLN